MSAPKDRSKCRRRKTSKSHDEDNDCASLAWLLNFRLDEIVNVKVPDDEPISRETKIEPAPDIPQALKKPPYTYPELIERALRERGELTVSALYQWISDRFPFYKASDERWKNSVRHNLSINPHFRKGARAPQGAGHLWSLAANAIDLLPLRNSPVYIEERTGETIHEAHIINCPKVIVLDEAAIAAASILPDQEFYTGSASDRISIRYLAEDNLQAKCLDIGGFQYESNERTRRFSFTQKCKVNVDWMQKLWDKYINKKDAKNDDKE